jgi:anti-sigma-K factor RskA
MAQDKVAVIDDKDYQLWAIRDDGTPVSLGLLPKAGKISIALDLPALAAISRSELLAVSLEPLGGSPKPLSTGPVLYSGTLFVPQG